jgi:membrane peptidoglycan carboxypeptidase
VQHALSELRQVEPFKGKPADYIQNGGFRIVTTVDKRAQDIAEATADIRRPTTPEPLRNQPANWQAALVSVEPGTGRVLAYYGGNSGAGADYAGWYYDGAGKPVGFGQHPPGSSFKVYDLAEAIRQKISPKSRFDSPATKEFPASGRTKSSPSGPIRNAGSARCQPNCTIAEATTASLNTTFFGLTEQLGPPRVIEMAAKAGVESMWSDRAGQPNPVRIDLRDKRGDDVMKFFSTELGIGQYGITVADHANGMATFAAGKRSEAHFVRSVHKGEDQVYSEKLGQTDIGLDEEQINQLAWTLSQVEAGKLTNGWDSAGKTGTWQHGASLETNAHTWMVGYTRALATAVWLGTTDGAPLRTTRGSTDVFGSSHPAQIWRKFMTDTTTAMKFDPNKRKFGVAKFPAESASPGPTPSAGPQSAEPSARPTCEDAGCPSATPVRTTPAVPTPPLPTTPVPPPPTQSAVPGPPPSNPGRDR